MSDVPVYVPVGDDDAVWQAYFEQRSEEPRRTTPWWVRVVGAVMAFALLVSAVTAAVQAIRYLTRISEPDAIVAHAEGYVNESPYGFLVAGIQTAPIAEPDVGAFVRANPADGVVTIDIRPWEGPGLDRIMAHEIGHLIDFALFETTTPNHGSTETPALRRGGLTSEVWAECAAVSAGTRSLDKASNDEEYHCNADELATFESVMSTVEQICVPWGLDVPCVKLSES